MITKVYYIVFAIIGVVYQYYRTRHNDFDFSVFKLSYEDARKLFLESVPKQMEIHSFEIENDCFMDIAVLKRSDKKLFIHVSGTHGVEGYAGSAIQSKMLSLNMNGNESNELPSIMFVHGMNPFGFKMSRRFNENNVDLNRNYLSKEEFRSAMNEDMNAYGYHTFYDFINPKESQSGWNQYKFYGRAARHVVLDGIRKARVALVSGNYHDKKSVNYGGIELQPSFKVLEQFVMRRFYLNGLQHVAIIDVHTGLGKSGEDTLQVDRPISTETAKETLVSAIRPELVLTDDSTEKGALSGYENAKGFFLTGFVKFLKMHSPQVNTFCVTQEFGTFDSLWVLKAMIAENAMYFYDFEHRAPFAQDLVDMFYPAYDGSWKFNVLKRGIAVAREVQIWLNTQP